MDLAKQEAIAYPSFDRPTQHITQNYRKWIQFIRIPDQAKQEAIAVGFDWMFNLKAEILESARPIITGFL